jgi:hypothetical protein
MKIISTLCLFLFLNLTLNAQTKDTVLSIDTLRHNGIDYVDKTCRYYPARVEFRDERPNAGKVISERKEFYNKDHVLWLIKESGEKNTLPNGNDSFKYFSDREQKSDSSSSELLVINHQYSFFGGIVCHYRQYDKTGKLLSDTTISTRKFNSMARKINRKRKKLMTPENSGAKILNIPLLPIKGFGK